MMPNNSALVRDILSEAPQAPVARRTGLAALDSDTRRELAKDFVMGKMRGEFEVAVETHYNAVNALVQYALKDHRPQLQRRAFAALSNGGGFRQPKVWDWIAQQVRSSREFAQSFGLPVPLPTDITDPNGVPIMPPQEILTERDRVFLRRHLTKE